MRIGFVIEETQGCPQRFLRNISISQINAKGNQASIKWKEYQNLTKLFMDKEYVNALNKAAY